MTQESIPTYTRIVNGQPVVVRSHVRANNDAAQAASKVPGRPPVAAHAGRYAGDRVLPGIWAADLNKKAEEAMAAQDMEDDDKVLPQAKTITEATSRILRELEKYSGPEVEELKRRLLRLPTDEIDLSASNEGDILMPTVTTDTENIVLALRKGRVSVTGYFRRTKNGLVHVRPYNQIRDLLSLMGGPNMAAKKGITTNLMERALQEDNRTGGPRSPDAPSAPRTPDTSVRTPNQVDTPPAETPPAPPETPQVSPQTTGLNVAEAEGDWGAPPPPEERAGDPWDLGIAPPTSPEVQATPTDVWAKMRENWDRDGVTVNPYSQAPGDGKMTSPYGGNPSFIDPSTQMPFYTEEHEEVRVNADTDAKAAFTPDGKMTAILTPEGTRQDPPTDVDSGHWTKTREDSFTRVVETEPAQPSSESIADSTAVSTQAPEAPQAPATPETPTPETPQPKAPKKKELRVPAVSDNKIFTHPSGKKFYIGAGDTALRHKTRKDSYLVVDSDGNPKMRISPTGRKFSEDDGAKVALYQPLAGSPEATVDMDTPQAPPRTRTPRRERLTGDRASQATVPEQETTSTQPNVPTQQRESESPATPQTQEAPSPNRPETPSADTEESTASSTSHDYVEVDSDQSRSWNFGVSAGLAGKTSGAQAWREHTEAHGADKFNSLEFRDGLAHYQTQKSVHDMWQKDPSVLNNTRNFTFDKNLFPGAWQSQMDSSEPATWVMPEVGDNDSWRFGAPSKDGIWNHSGYKHFKPGFNQSDDAITEAYENTKGYRNRGEMRPHTERAWRGAFRNGWNDAKKQWEEAYGVKADQSEEWNKGYLHEANNLPIPENASNDFKRGFNEAEANPPKEPAQAPNRTMTPQEWVTMTNPEKGRFIKHPHVKEVLDSHGNTWVRKGMGPRSQWTTGERGSTDFRDIPTGTLAQQYLTPARTESIGGESDLRTVPVGSTLKSFDGDISVKVADNGTLMLHGRPLESNYKSALDTRMRHANGLRVAEFAGSGAPTTQKTYLRQFEQEMDTNMAGLPNGTKALFHKRVHLEDKKDANNPTSGPLKSFTKVSPDDNTLPSMHFPTRYRQNDTSEEFTTPNEAGISQIVPVDEVNNSLRTSAVAHETGKYLEGMAQKLLSDSEQRDMYKDMRDSVLALVPESDRAAFSNFVPSGGSNVPAPNHPSYEFFRGVEFVKQNAPQAIQRELSELAGQSPSDLIGQSWASTKLSGRPSPTARTISNSLRKATQVGVRRFNARVGNRDFEGTYQREGTPTVAPVRERLQDRMRSVVDVDRTSITAGDIGVSRSNTNAPTQQLKASIPQKVTKDSAHDFPELVEHLRNSGTESIRGEVTTPDQAISATRLGFDFSDNERVERVTEALRVASQQRLSAKEEAFWESVQEAVDSDDIENLPTPQDIMASGSKGKAILSAMTQENSWETMVSIDTLATRSGDRNPLTPTLINPVMPSVTHGIIVDPANENAAKKMYAASVSRLENDYTPEELAGLSATVPDRYIRGSDAETISAAAVDYRYGSHSVEALDANLAVSEPSQLSPQGMDGYSDWLEGYSDRGAIKGTLQNFSTIQPYVNEKIREGSSPALSRVLDRAFRDAPGTTEDMRIFVPTDRQYLVPAGVPIKDSGYLKGTLSPSSDNSAIFMAVDVPKGTKLLHDGNGYIFPRNLQLQVDTVDSDNNTMGVSIIKEPRRDDTKFVRPPKKDFGRVAGQNTRTSTLDRELSEVYAEDSPSYYAAQVLRPAWRQERTVTPLVVGSVRTNGGVMNNMSRRIPTFSQATETIRSMAQEMQRKDPSLSNRQAYSRAVNLATPLLNYTATFRGANYRTGVESTVNSLRERGHRVDAIINRTTVGEGTRVKLTSPTGSKYTIDFHTTDSRIKSGLVGKLVTSTASSFGEAMDSDSTQMEMAQFLVRSTVVPPGAELLGEGLAEAATAIQPPPPPPPPPTTPPEMKSSERPQSRSRARRQAQEETNNILQRNAADPAILEAILRLDASSIAELYYGVGIPPQVWFALIERYNGYLPPELTA